jgi:predicted O-methyltransferase YrrM
VVQKFLLSDCTDLVFLDADVSWEPEALVQLCRYDCDLVGGVYPFRRDDIKARGRMPVRMIEGVFKPDELGLLEVEGLPAGFLRIRRKVLETLAADADQYLNRSDTRSKVPILFERTLLADDRMGGDIDFCAKWRAAGGKVFAAYEMRLGHTAKTVIHDSLGAALRRQADITLTHVAERVREGSEDLTLLREARAYTNNTYGALEDVLILCVLMARKADGPILEAGSGLSTILMAAANPDQEVYCIEHDPGWAKQLEVMAHKARTLNISIVHSQIKDGWYHVTDELPERFALALNDGPPRLLGSRMEFFERYGDRCETIIVDDADDPEYAEAMQEWATKNDRRFDFVDVRAALIRKQEKD